MSTGVPTTLNELTWKNLFYLVGRRKIYFTWWVGDLRNFVELRCYRKKAWPFDTLYKNTENSNRKCL